MDKEGVDDMFSDLSKKLGWFQFENIDSALKSFYDKSSKKKKSQKPKKNATEKKKKPSEDVVSTDSSMEKRTERSVCQSLLVDNDNDYTNKNKEGVDDMFSDLSEKLGWFQFENIDSARKFLNNKSSKKKKSQKPKKNATKEKKNPSEDVVSTDSSMEKRAERSVCQSLLVGSINDYTNKNKTIFSKSDIDLLEVPAVEEAAINSDKDVKIDCKESSDKQIATPEEKHRLSSSGRFNQLKETKSLPSSNVAASPTPSCKQRFSSETFSEISFLDNSLASISSSSSSSGVCKKMQFNSDDSLSFLNSKLEKLDLSSSSRDRSSNNNSRSFLGEISLENKTSSEPTNSTAAISKNDNHNIQTDLRNKLETGIEEPKKENEYTSDDDDDLDSFIQKVLTPNKKAIDSTKPVSGIRADYSQIKNQKKDLGISSFVSDSDSDKENNKNNFNTPRFVASPFKKNNDRTNQKKTTAKTNQTSKLQEKNSSVSNSSSQSKTSGSDSSSDNNDDDFEAFLKKMQTPAKQTPNWGSDSMDDFIVSSSEEISDDEDGEESLSLYHRTRKISPEIDKYSLFGTSATRSIRNLVTRPRESFDDYQNEDKTGLQHLTPKVKPPTEIFKKPLIHVPQTETKKVPKQNPSCDVTPKRADSANFKRVVSTCPNIKTSESLLKVRLNQPCEGLHARFLKSLSSGTSTHSSDPIFQKYVKKFKQNQVELVSKLFKIYNEAVFESRFPADFSIQWNKRLLTTAGHCILRSRYTNNRKECQRTAEICLATKVCDTAERVRDTLIHEMCHAAVWMLNGCREGHGPVWKAWAQKANRAFPCLPVIKRCHSYDITKKYTYKCVQCGYSFGRHSKSLDTTKKVCGYCKGHFELLLTNTPSNTPCSTPSRTPSKFALFVKEHYGTIKRREKCSHKEVMEKLSAEFKSTKI